MVLTTPNKKATQLASMEISIEIENFRSIRYYTAQLDKPFTHLSGHSGVGKTTIYKAIHWLIYGPIVKVTPRHLKKAKTYVAMTIKGGVQQLELSIKRSNNPRTLYVQDGQEEPLLGEAAQMRLRGLFGEYPLWIVGQKEDHFLLRGTTLERHESLMDMVFAGNDDYRVYLERAKAERVSLLEAQDLLQKNIQQLEAELAKQDRTSLTREHFQPAQSATDLQQAILTLKEKVKKAKELRADLISYRATMTTLERELGNQSSEMLRAQLEALTVPADHAELERELALSERCLFEDQHLSRELKSLQQQEGQLRSRERQLRQELITHDKQPLTSNYDNLDDNAFELFYQEQTKLCAAANVYKRQAEQLQLSYTKEALTQARARAQLALLSNAQTQNQRQTQLAGQLKASVRAQQEIATLQQQQTQTIQKLSQTQADIDRLTAQCLAHASKIDELAHKLSELRLEHSHALFLAKCQRLICPNCQEPCALTDKKLVLLTELPQLAYAECELLNLLRTTEEQWKRESQLQQTHQRELGRLANEMKRLTTQLSNIEQGQETAKKLIVGRELEQELHNLSLILGAHHEAERRLTQLSHIEYVEGLDLTRDRQARQARLSCNICQEKLTTLSEQQAALSEKIRTLTDEQQALPLHPRDADVRTLREQLQQRRLEQQQYERKLRQLEQTLAVTSAKEAMRNKFRNPKLEQQELPKLAELQDLLKKRRLRLERIQRAARIARLEEDLKHLHDEFEAIKTSLESVGELITELSAFKHLIISSSTAMLSKRANKILSNIFDDSVRVQVITTKVMKNGASKHLINVEIFQGEYQADFSSMGGGERERISLALALAVARQHPSPLLLLDEILSSLDKEARNRCLSLFVKSTINPLPKVIAGLRSSKIIVMTLHNAKSNFFDKTLTLTR